MPKILAQIIFNPAINATLGTALTNNSASKVQLVLLILLDVALGFGGIYFFFNLIRGGYEFITAGGDKDQTQNAKKRITNAIIGIIILFSIYVITKIVEAVFGVQILQINIPHV